MYWNFDRRHKYHIYSEKCGDFIDQNLALRVTLSQMSTYFCLAVYEASCTCVSIIIS